MKYVFSSMHVLTAYVADCAYSVRMKKLSCATRQTCFSTQLVFVGNAAPKARGILKPYRQLVDQSKTSYSNAMLLISILVDVFDSFTACE